MNSGRLIFPGARGAFVRRSDDRLVFLPALAAAGSRGRRGAPRLLPALPGRPVAVGFDGRWLLATTWRDGELLSSRIPPRSDEVVTTSLGEAAEPEREGLGALPGLPVDWPSTGLPAGSSVLRLGGAEPLVAGEDRAGAWIVASRRGTVRLEVPAACRVVSPARVESELGLATLDGRELSYLGSAGSRRRTTLGLAPDETAPCLEAPWLAVAEAEAVELRELGRTWARRLARWVLPPS